MPMSPQIPAGRPGLRVISVQWSPPSVVLNNPDPGPPEFNSHGRRYTCQNPAYSTLGLLGSITRSTTPAESLRKRIFSHVVPPSFERYTPRSGFAPNAWPSAPTYTSSGLVGCTTMSPICFVVARPLNVHVLPASVDFQTPSPCDTLPRSGYSPPPTYTMSGFDGATSTAPIVPPKYLSVTGNQALPPSVLLNTPPPVVPK